jgi:hypothetical protein
MWMTPYSQCPGMEAYVGFSEQDLWDMIFWAGSEATYISVPTMVGAEG